MTNDWQAEVQVLYDLVHGALVGPIVLRIGIDGKTGPGQDAAKILVGNPAREGAIFGDADFVGIAADRRLMWSAADVDAVKVAVAVAFHELLYCPDHMVDAVLLADLPEIDQQMALAAAPGLVRRIEGE